MPQAVLHILVPLVLTALFKDWYDKRHKNKFPLHYVLIAGLAGLVPDLDVAAFWILNLSGSTIAFEQIHKTLLHTIFVPLLFLILFLLFAKTDVKARICNIGRHNLKLSIIFLMIFFGSLVHLILDGIFGDPLLILYPISVFLIGVNLTSYLPSPLDSLFIPSLEAALLILWLLYLELRHKISDFI